MSMTINTPFKIPSSCSAATWKSDRWGMRESDRWPEGFPKPRTCSFCGGVHPEDLIELIKMGWEFEPSSKGYKSYWHPPGMAGYFTALVKDFVDAFIVDRMTPAAVDPVPPVKLYSDHLTPDLIATINSLLLINRAKAPGSAA